MNHADIKLLAQIGFSILILVGCGWIVLSGQYPDDYNKWAFGMIGVVIGYWLK